MLLICSLMLNISFMLWISKQSYMYILNFKKYLRGKKNLWSLVYILVVQRFWLQLDAIACACVTLWSLSLCWLELILLGTGIPGRITKVGQVEGEFPEKERHSCTVVWGLLQRVTSSFNIKSSLHIKYSRRRILDIL